MSQSVDDIIAIYDKLDRRGDIEKIPLFTKEDLNKLRENSVFNQLVNDLHTEILEADVELHNQVEEGQWEKASRANGVLEGMTFILRWMLEMKRYFDPEKEED